MSNLSNRYRDENGAIERKADGFNPIIGQSFSASMSGSLPRPMFQDWHLPDIQVTPELGNPKGWYGFTSEQGKERIRENIRAELGLSPDVRIDVDDNGTATVHRQLHPMHPHFVVKVVPND